jgi:DNA-binding transcriptional LysR family regulator
VIVDHSSPLPSLDTLRAFDAAVRLGSLSRAAAQVHLTHGAVSRRIAALEDQVGVELFERLPRGVLPTPAGLRLHAGIAAALQQLREALAHVADKRRARVRLSVLPSFAAHFLMSRLARFYSAHPEIDLELVAKTRLADFSEDGVDVAVRYGAGSWPGLRTELLMPETLVPVCSPTVLARGGLSRRPTLLHDGEEERWRAWRAEGAPLRPRRELNYEDFNVVIEAACAGLGVALGRTPLIDEALRSGRLVRASPREVASPFSYWLVTRAAALSPAARALTAFLKRECARS